MIPLSKLVCSVVVLLLSASAASVSAQTSEAIDRDARQIFETVLSPYCPGRTISNCPSPQADELRASIRRQLAAGDTPEEVKEELYAVFGDALRTVPRARGFGLLAWFVPGLAFLAGGWGEVRWARRARSETRETEPSDQATLDPESDARLQAEMAELESLT